MNTPDTRSYAEVLNRCRAALNPVGEWMEIDTLRAADREYPLIKITLGKGNPKRALISGGIHGDEPAGVETLCAFLENKMYQPYLDRWEFTILPCINPTGYEANTRNNHEDIDLNRKFKVACPPLEVRYVQSVLNQPYHLDLELHEDVDSDGYYLYQKDHSGGVTALGRNILDCVEPIHPLNESTDIEGTPAERGLLSRLSEPEEMDWWPMALYAYQKGCGHVFTLETSPQFPMEVRVNAHLAALQTALEAENEISG